MMFEKGEGKEAIKSARLKLRFLNANTIFFIRYVGVRGALVPKPLHSRANLYEVQVQLETARKFLTEVDGIFRLLPALFSPAKLKPYFSFSCPEIEKAAAVSTFWLSISEKTKDDEPRRGENTNFFSLLLDFFLLHTVRIYFLRFSYTFFYVFSRQWNRKK